MHRRRPGYARLRGVALEEHLASRALGSPRPGLFLRRGEGAGRQTAAYPPRASHNVGESSVVHANTSFRAATRISPDWTSDPLRADSGSLRDRLGPWCGRDQHVLLPAIEGPGGLAGGDLLSKQAGLASVPRRRLARARFRE